MKTEEILSTSIKFQLVCLFRGSRYVPLTLYTLTHTHTPALPNPQAQRRGKAQLNREQTPKVYGLKFLLLSSRVYIYKYFTLLFHTALVLEQSLVEICKISCSSCCVIHDKLDKQKEQWPVFFSHQDLCRFVPTGWDGEHSESVIWMDN